MNNKDVGIIIYAATLILVVLLAIYASYEDYFNTPKNGEVTMRKNEKLHRAMGKVNEKISNGKNFTKEILKRAKDGTQAILQKLGLIKEKSSAVDYFKKKK